MTATEPTAYMCPRCATITEHPDDVRDGYCGTCVAVTRGWQPLVRTRLTISTGELLLVGDTLLPGGRLVQFELPAPEAAAWSALDYIRTYNRMARDWLIRYGKGPTDKAPHTYLSTGCLHGKHAACKSTTGKLGPKVPATCKHCPERCICWCHSSPDDRRGRW